MRLAASAASGAPDPLRPQRPAGLGRGAMLALLVHGGLLLALALGVSWRASEPTGATAELWAAVPEFAAPAAEVPPPPPVESPPPPPLPVAKPEPKVDVAPSRDAEIAIEKARREREREREREQAQAREREAKAKVEAEKKRLLAQQEEQRKKLAAAAAQAEKAEKAEQERIEKLRQDNLRRIQGQAGATGGPTATGTAARDAGPSASYAGRIIAKVKPNIVLTETVTGSPRAEVEVRAAPDGTIVGRRLVKSSGNKDWDEAVLRALDRTEILPRDTDGRVPSPITIGFTP
jgi:colicin import membrane protein